MIPKITLWRRGTKEVRPAIPGLAGQKGQREQEENDVGVAENDPRGSVHRGNRQKGIR